MQKKGPSGEATGHVVERSFAATRAAVYNIVHEHVAVRTEVVVALGTSIPPEWTHALPRCARQHRGCCPERYRASVALFGGIRRIVQRNPISNGWSSIKRIFMSEW